MRKVVLFTIALVAVLGMATSAHATPISGSIGFAGAALPMGGLNWATATGVDFTNPAVVLAKAGPTYTGVATGTAVTFTDFTFKPALSPNPVNPLWTFDFDGKTYSFLLDAVRIDEQGVATNGQTFVTLSGLGVLSATGFDATRGTFSFSAQGTDVGNFTFSASNIAGVPDGGSALLLLGTALAGIAAVRRKWRG